MLSTFYANRTTPASLIRPAGVCITSPGSTLGQGGGSALRRRPTNRPR